MEEGDWMEEEEEVTTTAEDGEIGGRTRHAIRMLVGRIGGGEGDADGDGDVGEVGEEVGDVDIYMGRG